MNKCISPISIPVYRRKDQLLKCLDSLRASPLAKDSILYLYSDHPREGDEDVVYELRRSISNIVGFKKVVVVERAKNMGINNVIEAIEVPLNIHGTVIYLEEDIIVAPGFLEFMNSALERYENSPAVFSVTGYTMPCSCENGEYRVKASSVFSAWGCGLWKSKYLKFKEYSIQADPLTRLRSSLKLSIKLIYWHSFTQYRVYKEKCIRDKLTPDMNIGFYIWHKQLLQIFPTYSLVSNSGMDGSGWNCGVTNRYHHSDLASNKDFDFKAHFSNRDTKREFFKIRRHHGLNFFVDFKSVLKIILPRAVVSYFRRDKNK